MGNFLDHLIKLIAKKKIENFKSRTDLCQFYSNTKQQKQNSTRKHNQLM